MSENIRAAVESFIKAVKESVQKIPANKTSFEDSLQPNPLLRTDSDFRRGLAMNDANLRSILEDKDFDPSTDEHMKQAIEQISKDIRDSLKQLILVLIEDYRAFFNSDPKRTVEDIKEILNSVSKEIIDEVEEYDRLIALGEIKYRDDEQDYIWACMEEMKNDILE